MNYIFIKTNELVSENLFFWGGYFLEAMTLKNILIVKFVPDCFGLNGCSLAMTPILQKYLLYSLITNHYSLITIHYSLK